MTRLIDWVVAVSSALTSLQATVMGLRALAIFFNTPSKSDIIAAMIGIALSGAMGFTVVALMHYSRKDFETQRRLEDGTPKRT